MTVAIVTLLVLVGLLLAVAAASVRVLREYERAVVFRLGRLIGQKGPGPRPARAGDRPHGAGRRCAR